MKIWECKIGEVDASKLPPGADGPMRTAVADAYLNLIGKDPVFLFSGWGAELTEGERDVVENRAPEPWNGVELIAAERRRQVEAEGWTPEHDDHNAPGAMAVAGIVYATCAASSPLIREELREYAQLGVAPNHWPTDWDPAWWKPGADDSNASRIRELVKAGALIAAEIDRLQRVD